MDKSLEKCEGETSLEEGQSLKQNMKVEKIGVSGGHLEDSISLGENSGVMSTNHCHDNTYNFIMMQQHVESRSRENEQCIRYRPVHQRKASKKDKQLRLCDDSQDESSEEEFHDCVSTPPYYKERSFADDMDHTEKSHASHLDRNCVDIDAVMENLKFLSAEGRNVTSQFGIQVTDSVQCAESNIPLNVNRKKCVPPSDNTPGQWGLGTLGSEDWGFKADLKNVSRNLRLIARANIDDTVLIAKRSASESEKVFFFVQDLYIERISVADSPDQPKLYNPGENSDDFCHAFVDLGHIKCEIIRSKTKQCVGMIVVLAEISYAASVHLARYLSQTVFGLRRQAIDPT